MNNNCIELEEYKYKEIVQKKMQEVLKQNFDYPVIIWGRKTAAQICYRFLKKIGANIVAAGDNKEWSAEERFYDLPLMTVKEIGKLYPTALIVIGSFRPDVCESIIVQLKSKNGFFSFLCFEQIEYLYEVKCLERNISNQNKFFQIINNIEYHKNTKNKRLLNKNVVTEYRYILHDEKIEDLKEVLKRVDGIKTLSLIIDVDSMRVVHSVVDNLLKYDEIGHIVLVFNNPDVCLENKELLKALIYKVFYVICDENEEEFINYLKEIGFLIETKKLSGNISYDVKLKDKKDLTLPLVIQNVLRFVNDVTIRSEQLTNQSLIPVHIVQLFNGLANQMLMYLFGKYLEEESGKTVIFDDTILCLDVFDETENIRRISQWNCSMNIEKIRKMVRETRKKNSFYYFKKAEVSEVFEIPIRLLSDYFDEETWYKYLKKIKNEISYKYAQSFPLGQILLKNGVDIDVVRDSIFPDEFIQVDNCFCIDTYALEMPYAKNSVTDFILHKRKTTYYMGIWATGKKKDWLLYNREWVRNSFTFRLDLNMKNKKYAKEISESDGVVIHIRRGDFVHCDFLTDTKYFCQSIQETEKLDEYKNKKYFIFSDDLEWCRENKKLLGIDKIESKTVFVSGNEGKDSYWDIYLMSLGKVSIPTPGSSFSYVAILISKSMEKCVDVPFYLQNLEYQLNSTPVIIDLK